MGRVRAKVWSQETAWIRLLDQELDLDWARLRMIYAELGWIECSLLEQLI